MSAANLEERVSALEKQTAQLLHMAQQRPGKDAWRNVVGMFADDPQIASLHRETERIREKDRRTTRDAGQGEP